MDDLLVKKLSSEIKRLRTLAPDRPSLQKETLFGLPGFLHYVRNKSTTPRHPTARYSRASWKRARVAVA